MENGVLGQNGQLAVLLVEMALKQECGSATALHQPMEVPNARVPLVTVKSALCLLVPVSWLERFVPFLDTMKPK